MNILFIAYACEPDSISESFLAFETVCGIAERIDGEVHVLTRSNNLDACQNDARAKALNIVWHGCDGGRAWLWVKRHMPLFSIQLYAVYWQFLAARTARTLAQSCMYDVVHGLSMMSLHNFAAGLTGISSIIGPVGGGQEIPPSCRRYGDPVQELPRKWSIRLTPWLPGWRRAFSSARRIICANRETFDYFLGRGISAEQLCMRQPGYPGISAAFESGKAEKSTHTSSSLDPVTLFWGGRLVRCKGLEILLDAVAEALGDAFHILLHVTGDGPDRKYFEKKARRLGITDCIQFHGWLPKEDMHRLRASCRLLTFTSLRETTGLALIEMLLSEQPVAILDCGGPQAIINGLDCFSIQPENAVNDMVAAIRSVHDDYASALSKAREAKIRALERFDWNAYLDALLDGYGNGSLKNRPAKT